MKRTEFKKRINDKLNEFIDIYFGDNNAIDKITNSTLKVMLKANDDKIESMLDLVSCGDEIDAETIINTYVSNFPDEGFKIDIKDFIKNDFINALLPDKSLLIQKEDLLKMLEPVTTNVCEEQ